MNRSDNHSCVATVTMVKDTEFFKYKITYPKLVLHKNFIYHNDYNKDIIDSINDKMLKDVIDFKNLVKSKAIDYAKEYINFTPKEKKNYVKYQYEVYIDFDVTYDKNDLISIPITKYEFSGGAHGMTYLDTYNFNLRTGHIFTLGELFKPDVDYKKLVNNFIRSEIAKNPDDFFKGDDGFLGISDNQKFFVSDDGIVVYFDIYEIAPYYVGIPKFTLRFKDFGQYLNI